MSLVGTCDQLAPKASECEFSWGSSSAHLFKCYAFSRLASKPLFIREEFCVSLGRRQSPDATSPYSGRVGVQDLSWVICMLPLVFQPWGAAQVRITPGAAVRCQHCGSHRRARWLTWTVSPAPGLPWPHPSPAPGSPVFSLIHESLKILPLCPLPLLLSRVSFCGCK